MHDTHRLPGSVRTVMLERQRRDHLVYAGRHAFLPRRTARFVGR